MLGSSPSDTGPSCSECVTDGFDPSVDLPEAGRELRQRCHAPQPSVAAPTPS
jgi:hypothetical protein